MGRLLIVLLRRQNRPNGTYNIILVLHFFTLIESLLIIIRWRYCFTSLYHWISSFYRLPYSVPVENLCGTFFSELSTWLPNLHHTLTDVRTYWGPEYLTLLPFYFTGDWLYPSWKNLPLPNPTSWPKIQTCIIQTLQKICKVISTVFFINTDLKSPFETHFLHLYHR